MCTCHKVDGHRAAKDIEAADRFGPLSKLALPRPMRLAPLTEQTGQAKTTHSFLTTAYKREIIDSFNICDITHFILQEKEKWGVLG